MKNLTQILMVASVLITSNCFSQSYNVDSRNTERESIAKNTSPNLNVLDEVKVDSDIEYEYEYDFQVPEKESSTIISNVLDTEYEYEYEYELNDGQRTGIYNKEYEFDGSKNRSHKLSNEPEVEYEYE